MKYVIIGASAAGINAAKTIRKLDKSGDIIIISKDTSIYSRCMLHHIVGKTRCIDDTSFVESNFFDKYNVKWIKGKDVTDINIDSRCIVCTRDGITVSYDKLLIATGASPVMPPIKNVNNINNVYPFRDLEHALEVENAAQQAKRAIIIGAGLVGIDAAVGLIERGLKVGIVEPSSRILPLQLDTKTSNNYKKLFEKHGATIYTETLVTEILSNESGYVKAVKLSDGTEIPCEIVVVAAGVKPNIDFINDARIKVDKGIVVDNMCQTTVDSIYAAGDVCGKSGIWPLAVKQGVTAAYNMTGNYKILEDSFGFKNSMNFFGLETISIGMIDAPDDSYNVDILETSKVYKKAISKDGVLYGAIFQNDISYCGVFTQLIKNKVDISNINKNIFDINYSDFYGAWNYLN